MRNWFNSLSSKVIAIFILLAALSIGVLTVLAYSSSSAVVRDEVQRAMASRLVFRGDMLTEQLAQLESQATSIARFEALQQAMTGLKSGWNTIAKLGDAKSELKTHFITNNPNPAGQREKLLKPEGPSGFYYSTHETAQPLIAGYLADTHFRDLLIADNTGNVIYTFKKDDFLGENIAEGPLAQSGIGKAFAKGAEAAAVAVEDVAATRFSGLKVGASSEAPEVYFAVPIVKFGAFKGVFLFEVKAELFTGILTKGVAADSSEQASVLSADGSGIAVDGAGALIDIDGAVFGLPASAANDEIVTVDFTRADGAARAYARPVKFGGEPLTIVESVLTSEINAGSLSIAGILTAIGATMLVAMAIATGVIARRMFAPLAALSRVTADVADGRLETEVANQARKDEIGTMARSLERFRAALLEQRAQEARNEDERRLTEEERRQRMAEREAEARTLQEVVAALDQGLERLASGDLAFQITARFPAELESLRQNFNGALAKLSETMSSIGGNSQAVREGSEAMRSGADDLAARTERQAAAITETAAAINAITDAVKDQLARAEDAAKIAGEAKSETEASGEIMGETIAAMEAIQSSSRQINEIISVIDEIAFQTNLLALNAGVEAARAGESGKGFAVVAQEVRELAQRSAQAAKQITDLLAKSTREVESGVALVERAGKALEGIGTRVLAINGQIDGIMHSTKEEAQTLFEINSSVTSLDHMTQQNAVMVEETTAAIHKLAAEAEEMDGRLSQFSLPGEEDAGRSRAKAFRMAG